MATGNLSLILALKGIGREVAANDHWGLQYKPLFRSFFVFDVLMYLMYVVRCSGLFNIFDFFAWIIFLDILTGTSDLLWEIPDQQFFMIRRHSNKKPIDTEHRSISRDILLCSVPMVFGILSSGNLGLIKLFSFILLHTALYLKSSGIHRDSARFLMIQARQTFSTFQAYVSHMR